MIDDWRFMIDDWWLMIDDDDDDDDDDDEDDDDDDDMTIWCVYTTANAANGIDTDILHINALYVLFNSLFQQIIYIYIHTIYDSWIGILRTRSYITDLWSTAYLENILQHAKMEEAQSRTIGKIYGRYNIMKYWNTNMWFWRAVRLGAPTGSMPQSNVLTSHFKQQHPIPHNFRDPGDISKGWASASPSPEAGLIPESWHFRIDTNKQAFQVSTSSKNDHGPGVIWFSLT